MSPRPRRTAALTLAAALLLGAAPVVPHAAAAVPSIPAGATDVTVEHGPAPTATSVTENGPYTYATARISRWTARGYGGGTLYYPTNAAPGERFAGVVTIPGYYEPGSVMNVYGPRLASHGFVVLVADVVSVADYPAARARAARAAIEGLRTAPAVQDVLDPSRVALVGHSMGGGGVLEAAENADLSAVIAVHPWAQRGFGGVTEPSLVIGGLLDNVAPVSRHAAPIYRSLTSAREKGMLVHLSGTHWAGTVDDPAIQGRNLAFLKLMVDGDERYRPFFCAPAAPGTTFTSTC